MSVEYNNYVMISDSRININTQIKPIISLGFFFFKCEFLIFLNYTLGLNY